MQLDSSCPSRQLQSQSASASPSLVVDELFSLEGRTGSSIEPSSREHTMEITEKADDEITFNFQKRSPIKFDRLQGGKKRTLESESDRKADLKRRKTMKW